MRKRLKWVLVSVFLIVVGVLGFQFYRVYQEKETQAQKIASLPQFSLSDTKGKVRTEEDIDESKWKVFVFFNSECHYCQEEAEQLKDVTQRIKETDFIWISSESKETIKNFEKTYALEENPGIFFLHDPNAEFANACNIVSTPQFLVYDDENKLRKNHKGAWRIETLLEHLANDFKTP